MAHKLMKLFVEVSEGVSPPDAVVPVLARFEPTREASSVIDVCRSPELPLPELLDDFEVEVALEVADVAVAVAEEPAEAAPSPLGPDEPEPRADWMRESRSEVVVQVIDVPAELTRGKAAQLRSV